MKPWSEVDEAWLADLVRAGKSNATIAATMNRSEIAVKSRRSKLRLGKDRRFTKAQIDTVKRMYANHTAQQIAEAICKTVSGVHQLARRLKLPTKTHRFPPDTRDRIRELHSRNMTDIEIGQELGIDRRYIAELRAGLGLEVHQDRLLESRRRAQQTQLKVLGITKRTELRTYAFRKYAREHGLPEDLPPRCVQIVYALAKHGPMTLVQICKTIGKRWRPGKKNNLYCNAKGSGGSYPAYLTKLGIIVQLRRKLALGGQGHNVSIYDLTLPWRERITQHVQNYQTDGTHERSA